VGSFLKSDFADLIPSLRKNPNQGSPLSQSCYKIRFSITSKGKGKSGGARLITHFLISEETIFLISIYDKSEKENLTDKELDELLKYVHK
jgi:hypothetical protein